MSIVKAELAKSTRKNKQYKVLLFDRQGNKKRTVHFGSPMPSYPDHKDPERKASYISRHRKREDWNKSGIETAGFWSKHLLWNRPTVKQSIKDIERRFNITIST